MVSLGSGFQIKNFLLIRLSPLPRFWRFNFSFVWMGTFSTPTELPRNKPAHATLSMNQRPQMITAIVSADYIAPAAKRQAIPIEFMDAWQTGRAVKYTDRRR